MELDFTVILAHRSELMSGLFVTIQIVVLAATLGYAGGIGVSLLATSDYRLIRTLAQFYIEVFRTTPPLLQLMYVYLVFPPLLGVDLDPFTSSWITLAMNTSAFFSVILVSGFQSVDKTQWKAAKVLGLSHTDIYRRVIFPQVLRNIYPAASALFVTIIKYSSLAAGIGTLELTRVGQIIATQSFQMVEVLTAVAVIYFVLAYPVAVASRIFERRLRRGTSIEV